MGSCLATSDKTPGCEKRPDVLPCSVNAANERKGDRVRVRKRERGIKVMRQKEKKQSNSHSFHRPVFVTVV